MKQLWEKLHNSDDTFITAIVITLVAAIIVGHFIGKFW